MKDWKSDDPNPAHSQYIKLTGKYTSVDAHTANDMVDLFLTGVTGAPGNLAYEWTPFDANYDYKANNINLSGLGDADINSYYRYKWSYQENYNNIIIKSGDIVSMGGAVGYIASLVVVGNVSDIVILNKDSKGRYNGRYYTYNWSETEQGGVYRIPTLLSIYDETGDNFAYKNLKTYISKPSIDGTYFINSDINVNSEEGAYDDEGTLFNYVAGTATLTGRWHHVQFIDEDQFIFHKAAQEAADWYNHAEDLRHYETAILDSLRIAVETDGNRWIPQTNRIKDLMAKLQNAYDNVNMELQGDSTYGVIAAGDAQDVQRTYTVTGAPGDKIDIKIIDQTANGWNSLDSQYWTVITNGNIIGTDSTATFMVKFTPGENYPADYREYRTVLDVKIGNLNYQDGGKENLQQNLYGSNPILSLKNATLLQNHSLNLHRKDSITYDLYGHGYAYNYEKTKLVANFFDANGNLITSVAEGGKTNEMKLTFAKPTFTCYKVDNNLDQTKFTVAYYPEDLGVDVEKIVITDSIKTNIDLYVSAAKSSISFDPATAKVLDKNDNEIPISEMQNGTKAYFYPADGETYIFPIEISNFDGVNMQTLIRNEDGNIIITGEKFGNDGLVEEHISHPVQITIDNRQYFDVSTEIDELEGTGVMRVKVVTKDLDENADKGQHNALLKIIWQDQDTIQINLNQTQPYFGEFVDAFDDNTVWEFTETGDKIWYINVNDVDNYYNYALNFSAYTNTDWFSVNPSISYQTTPERGTRRYRLKIAYNPHEANTVYNDVLTLKVFDTNRGVVLATKTLQLKGDAVSSVKGDATGVNNVKATVVRDGKYFKDGKIVIVKGSQEYNASGASEK